MLIGWQPLFFCEIILNADKHSPASSVRSTKWRVRGGCLCQWELKAPTDRSRSDCVHEQVAKWIANVRFTKKPITVKSASANRNASSIITIKDTFYITFNHASP